MNGWFSDDDPIPGYDHHDLFLDEQWAADDYINDRLAHEADHARKTRKEGDA